MVNGGLLRPMLVGDSAYLLKNWLIKLFQTGAPIAPEKTLSWKSNCNEIVIERVFSFLKGRLEAFTKKDWTEAHFCTAKHDSSMCFT